MGRGEVIDHLLDGDRTWGTTTVRVRVRQWLDAFLVAAELSGLHPALREAGGRLAAVLADAWPDAVLGDYPALATGASTTIDVPDFWRPGL